MLHGLNGGGCPCRRWRGIVMHVCAWQVMYSTKYVVYGVMEETAGVVW